MISIRKIRLLEAWKTKSGLVISYSVITLDQVFLKLLGTAYFFCQIYVLGWKKSQVARFGFMVLWEKHVIVVSDIQHKEGMNHVEMFTNYM